MNKNDKEFFWALDGFRGIAAISVVIYHISRTLGPKLLPNAYLAVDFFFLLSGFVIAHTYEQRLQVGLGWMPFMRRRLERLYPLFFLGITAPLVLIFLQAFAGQIHLGRSLALSSYGFHVLMLPTPPFLLGDNPWVFPLNGAAWSLSLEIAVNALFALGLFQIAPRNFLILTLGCALLLVVATLHYNDINTGSGWKNYWGGWTRVLWSFFAGIVLYRAFRHSESRTLPAWVAVALGLGILTIFHVPGLSTLGELACVFLAFPYVVWMGARVKLEGSPKALAAWLGLVSYAVYITHMPVLNTLELIYFVMGIDPVQHLMATIALWTVFCVLAAWTLHHIYDVPMRRFLAKKFLTHRRIEPA